MRFLCMVFVLVPLCAAGCSGSAAKPTGGTAEKVKVEGDLAFTTISKKAFVSLDIKVEPIKVTEVNERLTLTGWIMAKPGHEVTLTAPAAGYVRFVNGGAPVADQDVTKGEQ